jgi:hypothetical protein
MAPVAHLSLIQARRLALRSLPTPMAYGRHLIRRTLECHGLATEKEITYLKPYARTAVRQAVQAMTEQGALLPITVEGLSEVYFVLPDHLEQTLSTPRTRCRQLRRGVSCLPLTTWSCSANVSNSCSVFITRSNAMCPQRRDNMATSAYRFSGGSGLSDALIRRRIGPHDALKSSHALWTVSCMVTWFSGLRSHRRYRRSPRLMGVRPSRSSVMSTVYGYYGASTPSSKCCIVRCLAKYAAASRLGCQERWSPGSATTTPLTRASFKGSRRSK